VKVDADGFIAEAQSVDLPAKSETDIRITLGSKDAGAKAPGAGSSTRTIVGWSLAGTSGIALVAGGIMALRSMSLSSDYEDRSSPSFQDRDVKDEGIAFRTGADIALVAALLAGAGAAVLLLTDIGEPGGSDVARVGLKRPLPPALLRW
jgi:hypothetical protein